MPWEIRFTSEAADWFRGLDDTAAHRVTAALDELRERGPALGRPLVDGIKGSRHHNMKELRVRSRGHELRALFAFDPNRRAVMLVGGDKTHQWNGWYPRKVRLADNLLDRHLRDMGKETLWSHASRSPGRRSEGRGR